MHYDAELLMTYCQVALRCMRRNSHRCIVQFVGKLAGSQSEHAGKLLSSKDEKDSGSDYEEVEDHEEPNRKAQTLPAKLQSGIHILCRYISCKHIVTTGAVGGVEEGDQLQQLVLAR